MNSWWLKIYTIPSLKKLVKVGFITLLLDLMITDFISQLPELAFISYYYFIYNVFSQSSKGIGQNMGFHQSHMNYDRLARETYLEAGFYSFCVLGGFSVIVMMSYYLGGAFSEHSFVGKWVADSPILISLLLLTLFLFISGLRLMPNWSERYLQARKTQKQDGVIYFSTIVMLLILYMLLSFHFNLSIELLGIMTFFASCLYILLSKFLTFFHLIDERKKMKNYFRIAPVSFIVSASVVYLFSFFAHIDILNPRANPTSRMTSFSIWSAMAPELDLETFKVLERESDILTVKNVYHKSRSAIEGLPVEDVLTKITPLSVMNYLEYAESTPRDHQFLADHLFSHIDNWKKERFAKDMIGELTKKCQSCWRDSTQREFISSQTNYEWPKEVFIDKRNIASEAE